MSLVKVEPAHRIAQFLLGCEAFKQGNYKDADQHFAAARQGPIADLASTLARAWVQQADGKTDEAFATLDSLERCRLGAVLSALSPRPDRRPRRQARRRARQAFAQAFKKNPATFGSPTPMRARGEHQQPQAREQTLKDPYRQVGAPSLSEALLNDIEAGKTPPLLVTRRTTVSPKCSMASATRLPARAASTWASSSCNSRSI